MKIFLPSAVFCCFLLCGRANAQYLQFVENKGQWDSTIQYKANFVTGAIAIKPDGGYMVQLNNRDDLKKIGDYIHANKGSASKNLSAPAKAISSAPQAAQNAGSAESLVLHSHVYDVKFINANAHPVAIAEKKIAQYNNYFLGNNPAKWAGHCAIYTAVTLKNVYPNIDVHYYTGEGSFRYDIVVNPGGDVSKVAMDIEGADSLNIKQGSLVVKTSVDEVKEVIPNSFELTPQGNKKINCHYDLKGKIVRFKFDEQIPAGTPLVIDPSLIFCSFSGSSYDNWGYTATYDNAGDFYAGGIVFGPGFKVTPGAFQTSFAGGNNGTGEGDPANGVDMNGFDMGIIKFNPDGTTVMYATYIGGKTGNEQPHSLVVDAANNLIIAGRSTSSDYPTVAPNLIGPGGGQDIVITKLSADGSSLIGSLRIGGKSDDGVNIRSKDLPPYGTESTRRNYGDDARSEVILDASGNIYLASCTQSNDFPTFNALYSNLSGNQNAVLLKFAPNLNGNPLFSTLLGGNGNDAAFVLALDPLNSNIYVGGATSSTNFPGMSGTAGSPLSGKYIGGACDGFISIISNDGSQLIKSSYFGTSAADQIYGIDFGKTGDPFIMGTTEGIITPVSSPFNANNNQSEGKQFITKLQPDLSSVVYSANFGPGGGSFPNISPTAFLVDNCENVYVSGWGGGLDGDYANAGPEGLTYVANGNGVAQLTAEPQPKGSFYFFVLKRNAASQLFGAFLGDAYDLDGVHVDGGTSRFDKSGIIYQAVCACGPDNSLPSDSAAYRVNGAYQANVPYFCNLTSLKIAFDLSGVRSDVISSIKSILDDTVGCVPLPVIFNDTIGSAQKYIWNFGDGSPDTTTLTTAIQHVYTKLGTYTIRLVAVDSTTCNVTDTSYTDIHVKPDSASIAFTDIKLLPCQDLNYDFINQSSAPPPDKPFGSASFEWNFGDGTTLVAGDDTVEHHYNAPGTYTVVLNLIDTNYCNTPQADSLLLSIAVDVTAGVAQPPPGCVPYSVQFNNTTTGGQTFSWDFGDGSTSTSASPTHVYSTPGTYTVKLVAQNAQSCNKIDSTTTTVTVYPIPTAGFTFNPTTPQENTPTTFTNTSLNAVSYKWSFGDGTTLYTTNIDTPVSHIYLKTGTYNVCLTAYSAAGCADSMCQAVAAIIIPLVDVPNALTPNGDGINDMIHVKGFGIEKMDWRIYNRWGTMVFRSTAQSVGWDGKYNGVLQPQEVYVYVLNIQFSDGTNYTKKGDITLLR